jgi:hypothetical protein
MFRNILGQQQQQLSLGGPVAAPVSAALPGLSAFPGMPTAGNVWAWQQGLQQQQQQQQQIVALAAVQQQQQQQQLAATRTMAAAAAAAGLPGLWQPAQPTAVGQLQQQQQQQWAQQVGSRVSGPGLIGPRQL